MCVACGQELCKNCKGCHNVECERYTEPTDACGSKITHNRRRGEVVQAEHWRRKQQVVVRSHTIGEEVREQSTYPYRVKEGERSL